MSIERLSLSELKAKSPKDLLAMAEDLDIENASTMRKGEMMFQILRERADEGWEISGDGVLEVLQDGFGFLYIVAGRSLAHHMKTQIKSATQYVGDTLLFFDKPITP